MSRRVCLFGELDAFSGSFPQALNALPALIKQLKIACLLYDEVIVNTNVLLDHALTLPAFNALSEFTTSGVLWTSAVENQGQPENYIVERAKKLYGENLNEGISKNATTRLSHIVENWQIIAPKEWRLVRTVAHQQQNATSNIIYNLQSLPFLSKQAISVQEYLIELVSFMQDQGVFNRNEIVARLGGIKEQITLEELSQLNLIVQGEYMNQGAHNKGDVNISLFPGKYIQYLKQHQSLFQAQALPTDIDTLEKTKLRLLNSGFPLNKLASISSRYLFLLSQSADWKKWRNYVLSDSFSYESVKEMKSLQKAYKNLELVLPILLKNIDVMEEKENATELLLPSPWLSSGLSLLGVDSRLKPKKENACSLNLSSRQLSYDNKKIILEKSYINLLSLMATTGNLGLPIETIKQLDVEVDLVKRTFQNSWRPQKEGNIDLNIASLNRLNVAKNRLNKRLLLLSIFIHVDNGLWKLKSIELDTVLSINLVGTFLEKQNSSQELLFPKAPEKMSKRQQRIWNFLIRRHATFVRYKAIAIEIDLPDKTSKQISDIMYKFEKNLKDSSYQLIKSFQGDYMLLNNSEG